MILVDTSVLIDMFKGNNNAKQVLFRKIVEDNIEWGISVFTYQELLQGAKNDKEYELLVLYLNTQKIYLPVSSRHFYTDTATLYYKLRRKGITIRSTIDMLIAQTAITYKLQLLHNDRDFDYMAEHIIELQIAT